MILSYSKKFIFIHLEKCGGTSIEEFITPFLPWDDVILGGQTYGWQMINLYRKQYGDEYMMNTGLYKHSIATDIKRYLGEEDWNKYYKFATVRDPQKIMKSLYFFTERNISQYINQLEDNKIYDVIYIKNYEKEIFVDSNKIFTDDIGYKIYLESMFKKTNIDGFIKEMLLQNNRLTSPQLLRLDSSVDLYDIEYINENWKTILNKININSKNQLPILNKSKDHSKIILQPDTVDAIRNHFEIDYLNIPKLIKTNWK